MGNQAMEILFKFPKRFQCAANARSTGCGVFKYMWIHLREKGWNTWKWLRLGINIKMMNMENLSSKWVYNTEMGEQNFGLAFTRVLDGWQQSLRGDVVVQESLACFPYLSLTLTPSSWGVWGTLAEFSEKLDMPFLAVKHKEGCRINTRSENLILPLWGYNWKTIALKLALRSRWTSSGMFPRGCWEVLTTSHPPFVCALRPRCKQKEEADIRRSGSQIQCNEIKGD